MKRIITIILATLFAISFSAGCRVKNDNNGFDKNVLKEIDLTADEGYAGVLNIKTTSEESEVLIMNSLIQGFNEKYPYIKVNYTKELIDNYYSSITNDIGLAEQTKDYSKVSDVFWMAQDRIDSFYNLKKVMFPLTEIDKIDDSFSSDILVDETKVVSMVGDTLYMMPRDFNQVVMYFNQDIFDIAGVQYPTERMNKEQFVTMLKNLRTGINNSDATNDYGVKYKDAVKYLVDVNSQWDSWVWPLVKSFGGEIVDKDGNAAMDSKVFDAVSFWKSLREADYVGPVSTTNAGVNFRMQQSAIYFHARAVLSDIIKHTKQIKGVQNLGVTTIPQFGPQYAIGGGSSGYAMYLNAEHKTEAWLFLKYVVSAEGQNRFCETGNGIPSVKSMLMDENSSWRKYTSEAFGTAFDKEAFIYGIDGEEKPFTSTRDFFQYIPVSIQSDVLTCLRSCFTVIDTENNSDKDLKDQIANQNSLIEFYIERNKK